MNISVVHREFDVDGGGERVTLSLLRALDRTAHNVELRCVLPPTNVSFGGKTAPRRPRAQPPRLLQLDASLGGGRVHVEDVEEERRPACELERTRLTVVVGGRENTRALFGATECDLLVVTDGGFVVHKTDAPHTLLYGNSDLSYELERLHRRFPPSLIRWPLRILRRRLKQAAFRREMAIVRDGTVTVIPNTASTSRSYASQVGRHSLEKIVHPPVDLGRFTAMQGIPKEPRVATVGRFAPEKNYERAIRIMHGIRARWDAVGNATVRPRADYLDHILRSSGPNMHFHVNASEGGLDKVLGGAKVYLHPRAESFGITVVEAAAAGCVPIVPDNSAHPETVPFGELRYKTEAEAAAKVEKALRGEYDHILPALREHVQKFSEKAFQGAMVGLIEQYGGGASRGGSPGP